MPARVYECNKSEVEELKKVLTYDPYLDPNLLPPNPAKETDRSKMTPEQIKASDERDKLVEEKLKEAL